MATIYLSLSTKIDATGKQEIKIRFVHGRIDQRAKTGVFIQPEYWNKEEQKIIIPNFRLMNKERTILKQYLTDQSEKLTTLISTIQTVFNNSDKKALATDWLIIIIDNLSFG